MHNDSLTTTWDRTMRARKRFSQNFLTDGNTVDRIVAAIAPRACERIIEIGPGHGALTDRLLASGCSLQVVEIDRDLAAGLRERYPGLDVIEHDILKLDLESLLSNGPVRLVGNLPYNISTPLLFKLFAHIDRIQDMHFMLQLEVVERMIARSSTSNYGRLSVMSQFYCDPEKLFSVAASAFTPKPKVMSSIVRLSPKARPVEVDDVDVLGDVVNRAFSQRRKTIRNALKSVISEADMQSLGLDPQLRPENLDLEDYAACANFVARHPDA